MFTVVGIADILVQDNAGKTTLLYRLKVLHYSKPRQRQIAAGSLIHLVASDWGSCDNSPYHRFQCRKRHIQEFKFQCLGKEPI